MSDRNPRVVTLYGKTTIAHAILRRLIPVRFRKRLSGGIQAWMFREIAVGKYRLPLLDNLGLTITIPDKPEPPEGV